MNYHVIENIDVYNYTDLTLEKVKKLLNKLMSEPDFRRGDLETTVEIEYGSKLGDEIEVNLGLFDAWGGENNEEGDVWGDYPTKIYNLSDFS